jgi:hypothetical protein
LAELAGAFGSTGTSDREQEAYRKAQQAERHKAEKRPRAELKGEAAALAATGMNGSTMQIMRGIVDSDDESGSDGGGKRRKKDKKVKKDKKSKKDKKVKKRAKKVYSSLRGAATNSWGCNQQLGHPNSCIWCTVTHLAAPGGEETQKA